MLVSQGDCCCRTGRAVKKSLLVAVVAIASIIYAPLGWCPPPPNFGVFLPSGQLISLGAVPVDTSKSIAITFLLAPSTAAAGPYGPCQVALLFGNRIRAT